MSHPCHTLSNPSAQLFWCRHCMKIFEDPIQRWRHSKTCKKLVTSNPEQKILGRDGRLLDVRAGNAENQVIVTDLKAQKDKNGTRKSKSMSELSCYICKKEFNSFESMKEHVKRSCNRPEVGQHKDPQSTMSESLLVDRTKNDSVSVQIESLLKAAQQHQEQEQQKQQQQQQQILLSGIKSLPENTPMEESLKDIHFELLTDGAGVHQLQKNQVTFDGATVDRLHKTADQFTIDINARKSSEQTAIPDLMVENEFTNTTEAIGTVITEVHIVTQGNIQQDNEEDTDSDLCTFVPPRCRFPVQTNIHYTETIDRTPKPISTKDHECVLLSDGTITDGETSVLLTGAVQTVLNESKSLKRKTSDGSSIVSKPKQVKIPNTRLRSHSEEISKKSLNVVDVKHVKDIEFGLIEKENVLNEVHVQSSPHNDNLRLNSLPDNSTEESSTSEISEVSPSDIILNKTVEVLPAVEEVPIQISFVSKNNSSKENELCLTEKSSEKYETLKQLSLSDNETSKSTVRESETEKIDIKIKETQYENGENDNKINNKENNMEPDRQLDNKNKKEMDKNETKEKIKDKKEKEKPKTVQPKKKLDKPVKCRICDREFKSSQALQKHNKVPCKIKHTRNLTQKVLRPKRTAVQKPQLPEPKKKKGNSSKTGVNNKPKLLLRSDRRYSDTILSVKTKKGSKNKNRRKTLPEYHFHFSCCKQFDNSKLGFKVDYESLSEKEQYFFHLEMIPFSRLPSDMHPVVVTQFDLANASSVKENVEDIIDGPFLPPPVLEKIPDMIKIESNCNKITNNDTELEPPVLEAISEVSTNSKLLSPEIELVPQSQPINTVVANSADTQSMKLHEVKGNAGESPTKKVENRHFLDVITKLSPGKTTDICCKTSNMLSKQISSEPISPSKYSPNRHFTDIITVSTDSTRMNTEEISGKDPPSNNTDDKSVSNKPLQENNNTMQSHLAARYLKFGHENDSSDCTDSNLNLDKNKKSFCKVTVGIQTENNSPEKVIYPSSSSTLNSQHEIHTTPNEKVKSKESRNLFESFLNISRHSGSSKNDLSSAQKLSGSGKGCHIPAGNRSALNSVVSQNAVSCSSKDMTVKGNYNKMMNKPTKYQEIMVYPPKKELPISAPGPSIDKETNSNNELLELLAKSLGIYPESQSSQSVNDTDCKKNVSTSSANKFNSGSDGEMSKPSITKANLGDGNVQIIILNNSASNQDYTTDINVIDVPKPTQKNCEKSVEPLEKSTKNTYVPVSTGYKLNTSDSNADVDTGSFVLGGIQLTKLGKAEKLKYPLYEDDDDDDEEEAAEFVENNPHGKYDDVHFSSNTIILPPTEIQDNTESTDTVQEMKSILPQHLQLHRTSSSSSGIVRPVSVPLTLSDSSCTTLRLQGPLLEENPDSSGIQVLKNKKDSNVNSSLVNHLGHVYSNSVIFNSDADLQYDLNSASCTNPESPRDISNKSANSKHGADFDNTSSDLSQSNSVKLFLPVSVKNGLAHNTSSTISVPALSIPESNLDEPCVMVQYVEQVQDQQNISYVYFDEDDEYTEESTLTSALPVSYSL